MEDKIASPRAFAKLLMDTCQERSAHPRQRLMLVGHFTPPTFRVEKTRLQPRGLSHETPVDGHLRGGDHYAMRRVNVDHECRLVRGLPVGVKKIISCRK